MVKEESREIVLKDDPGFEAEKYMLKKLKDIKAYAEMREALDAFIKDKLIEDVDFGVTDPRSNTKTLKKAGAEKIDILLGLEPVFMNDSETWNMFGKKDGMICLICFLMTHQAKIRAVELIHTSGTQYAIPICAMMAAGEGRGAGTLSERTNSNPNDLIKRIQKRAQVDATLRVAGLSERFTQDMEEDQTIPIERTTLHSSTTTTPVKEGNVITIPSKDITVIEERKRMTEDEQMFLSELIDADSEDLPDLM
jgi:hypothetical protein